MIVLASTILRALLACFLSLAHSSCNGNGAGSGCDDTAPQRALAPSFVAVEFTAESSTNVPSRTYIDASTDEPFYLVAGGPYRSVTLHYTGTLQGSRPLISLVPLSMTESQAQAGACGTERLLDSGYRLSGELAGQVFPNRVFWDLQAGIPHDIASTHRRRSAVRAGGHWRICFTSSGNWASGATLVPRDYSNVVVYGATLPEGAVSMQFTKHYCFEGARSGTECRVLLNGVVGDGANGSTAWQTDEFRMTWSSTRLTSNPNEHTCGGFEPAPVMGVGRPSLLIGSEIDDVLHYNLGFTSNRFDQRNFWLCYCPTIDADKGGKPCDTYEDYLQAVGLLYVFSVWPGVATITPVARFDLNVNCGDVNGCAANTANRIKVLDPSHWEDSKNINNLPIWDAGSGCRISSQSKHFLAPFNCVSPTECSPFVNGGTHVDFKIFKDLMMDNDVIYGVTRDREFDVCYCNEECHIDGNWFKVGIFEVMRGWVNYDRVGSSQVPSLAVVNTPGILRLGTKPMPFPGDMTGLTNSFHTSAQYKLLEDPELDIMDMDCATDMPSPIFLNHGCSEPGQCYPFGWKNSSNHIITFNAKFYHGGILGRVYPGDPLVQDPAFTTTVQQPGLFAVCYCEDACSNAGNWARLTTLTIRGPVPLQQWIYQSLIPFDLVIKGTLLGPNNRIKIIKPQFECSSQFALTWDQMHVKGVYSPFFNATVLTQDSRDWQLAGIVGSNPIVKIERVPGTTGSIITFMHDVRGFDYVPVVKPGDRMVFGNLTVDDTGLPGYTAPATATHREIVSIPWGHKISRAALADDSGRRYEIPVTLRHLDGSDPTWSPTMHASWVRTSEEAFQGLETYSAQKGLRVCWSDHGTEAGNFVVQAGTLDVQDAPIMAASSASILATQLGVVTPLVLAFRTSTLSYFKYQRAVYETSLRIELSTPYITLHSADLRGYGVFESTLPSAGDRTDQLACGKLFKELWSSHPNGFPVPSACLYDHLRKIYTIIFDRKNGLTSNTEYHIVMNVVASAPPGGADYWYTQQAARLFSMDDSVTRKEFAIEVGSCFFANGRAPVGPGVTSPKMSFKVIDANLAFRVPEVVDLTSGENANTLTFRLSQSNGASPVTAGHQLRLFFFPLTEWNLAPCVATCSYTGRSGSCGYPNTEEPECLSDAVVGLEGAQRNMAYLKLPGGLVLPDEPPQLSGRLQQNHSAAEQEKLNASLLQIRLHELPLPEFGFYPERFALEATTRTSERPQFAWSDGARVFVPPQLRFGGIVNSIPGDGNDHPFRGDQGNNLYFRLILGATLHSYPLGPPGVNNSAPVNRTAAFTLYLPNDFTIMLVQPAPQSLAVFGQDVPQGRGTIPASDATGTLGHWDLRSSVARFSLARGGTLFGGSSIYLRLVVANPLYTLPRADTRNVWYVTSESFGETFHQDAPIVMKPQRLKVGTSGHFNNNMAVEGELVTSMNPRLFTLGARLNELSIFLKAEQNAGPRSQIRVFGPVGDPYNFGERCEARLLAERYYVDLDNPEHTCLPLPGMRQEIECTGIASPIDPSKSYGAFLQLSGSIRARQQYGFALVVTNPESFNPDQMTQWRIQTYTQEREEIDRTRYTVPYTPRQQEHKSFGLFEFQPSQVDLLSSLVIALSSRLPVTLTLASSALAVGGLWFPKNTICRLRVIAPELYEWTYAEHEFRYLAEDVLPKLPNGGLLGDGTYLVQKDLPSRYIPPPVAEPVNVLTDTADATFEAGVRYGFATRIQLPSRPNTGSLDSFIVQCGAEETTIVERPLAAYINVPVVAALVDVSVGYTTNIVGMSNRLRFRLRTSTIVASTGALVIKGPPDFRAAEVCVALTLLPSMEARLAQARINLAKYEELESRFVALEALMGEFAPAVLALGRVREAEFQSVLDETSSIWADRQSAHALPLDMGCTYKESTEVRPFTEVIMQVGNPHQHMDTRIGIFVRRHARHLFRNDQRGLAHLPAGIYNFELEVTNPTQFQSNRKTAKSISGLVFGGNSEGCGYEICWEFLAFAAPYQDRIPSDYPAEAPGFAVVTRMQESFLPNLTLDQRRLTGRNDRPGTRNQLIIVFKLAQVVPPDTKELPRGDLSPDTKQLIVLQAPLSFEFPEECAVVIDRGELFGRPDLEPRELGLTTWLPRVTGCTGNQHRAEISVTGYPYALSPNKRYGFRIDIQSNPKSPTTSNLWTLEFHGRELEGQEPSEIRQHSEASAPFKGFDLWTFPQLRVFPRTTERSHGSATTGDAGLTLNEITVIFEGLNVIPGQEGALRLEAPDHFIWRPSTGGRKPENFSASGTISIGSACEARLKEMPEGLAADSATAVETSSWASITTVCTIHVIFPNVLWVWLIDTRSVKPYRRYALKVMAINPSVEVIHKGAFSLSSWQYAPHVGGSGGSIAAGLVGPRGYELLDVAETPGFPVTKGLGFLTVTPLGGAQARGGLVNTISIATSFEEPVFPTDILRLVAPPGYMLRSDKEEEPGPVVVGGGLKPCYRVLNRAKPGPLPDQSLRCFVGIRCVLRIAGTNFGENSHVQLFRTDRPCGTLPGMDLDTRRTRVERMTLGEASYDLGLNLAVSKVHVCYCHGDAGCSRHENYCQDLGNLAIVDLCASSSCPRSPSSCRSRCDPRSGLCIDGGEPSLLLPDGFQCMVGERPGACQAGECISPVPYTTPRPTFNASGDGDAPDMPASSCTFDQFDCEDRTLRWMVGHNSYARSVTIHFEVDALLPEATPRENNDFVLSHERGTMVRGRRVVEGFSLQTLLWNVEISRVGRLQAGGAFSDLDVQFRPVSAASSIWLRAKQPIGFDFTDAFLPVSNGTVLHAVDDTIEVRTEVRPKQTLRLLIHNVQLPLEEGQSLFDVVTFTGTELRDSISDVLGFRTLAHVDVSEVALLNKYKRDTSGEFVVEAGFGNRVAEWAQLRLILRLSDSLPPPLRLLISAPFWRFSPGSAEMTESQLSGEVAPVSFKLLEEAPKSGDGTSGSLDLLLASGLASWDLRRSYAVSVDVLAPGVSQCGCWADGVGCMLCEVNWTVEVFREDASLLATNDGLLRGFPLVSELIWEVFAPRAPPTAALDLAVRFTEVGAIYADVLIITAPLGYEFPYACLALDSEKVATSSDSARFTSCVGRLNTAVLQLDKRGLFQETMLPLLITTPRTTPPDNRWFVAGRVAEGNQQVNWGVATGLLIETLRVVSVEYARFQSLDTYFLVRLTPDIEVRDKGSVAVLPPPGYLLTCDRFRHVRMPSPPGEPPTLSCSKERQGVRISFEGGVLAKETEYSFIVFGGTAASSTTQIGQDVFDVKVSDGSGRVVDASNEVPAMRLRSFGDISSPFLLWYDDPKPESHVWVTIGLQVAVHADFGLEGLRISLPEGFEHDVRVATRGGSAHALTLVWHPTIFAEYAPGTFSNYLEWQGAMPVSMLDPNNSIHPPRELPVVPENGLWLLLGERDKIEVRFTPTRRFPAGELLLQFPVLTPPEMPALNVWRVALMIIDDELPPAFVLPGFDMGQKTDAVSALHARHSFQRAGLQYYAWSKEAISTAKRAAPMLVLLACWQL